MSSESSAKDRPIRVCLLGLGSIGSSVARALFASPRFEITGAIDTDPDKINRDLRSLLRLKGESGISVNNDMADGLRLAAPDVVVHCTGSRLAEVAPQLEYVLDAGIPCVTSCEEMAFPWGTEETEPVLARQLDNTARKRNVALLGAGVNPGFVMDALVLALSGATRNVSHIFVERVLDPLTRRRVFQKKVGIGLEYRQAVRKVQEGSMGHVGMKQSAMLVAAGMGWKVNRFEEETHVLCEGETVARRTRRVSPPDARVTGLQQSVTARDEKGILIRMEMLMVAGAEAPHDAITITGEPDLNLWIQGGIPGDQATVSCLINAIHQVLAPPRAGLLTLLDLPLRPARPDGSTFM